MAKGIEEEWKKSNRKKNKWHKKKATQKPNGAETTIIIIIRYQTQNETVTNSHFNGIFKLKIYLYFNEKFHIFLCATIHVVIASIEYELKI